MYGKDVLPGTRNPGPDLFPFPHRQPDPWVARTSRPKEYVYTLLSFLINWTKLKQFSTFNDIDKRGFVRVNRFVLKVGNSTVSFLLNFWYGR